MKGDSDMTGIISDLALINAKIVTVDGNFNFIVNPAGSGTINPT